MSPYRTPWADLPAELPAVLRPELPALADEIIAAIRRDVPDYARPLTGPFGSAVRTGVERALGRFLNLIEDPSRNPGSVREIYVQLGTGEFREGRSLDALQSAYRIGARLAWRRFVDAGKRADVDPDVLFDLGESIFAYIEGLAAESTEGYATARSEAAGERARERRQLAALLLQQPPPERRVAEAAAERAGWPLPATLAVLAVAPEDAALLAGRLGPDALALESDGGGLVVIADPGAPGRSTALSRALGRQPDGREAARRGRRGGARAALGPTVAWDEAATSAERARLGHRLQLAGRLPGPLAVTDEHLPELVLHADPALAARLAEHALAPLAELAPAPRAKLTATLRAWLDHQGRVDPIAYALGVHAQTVRYRMQQLRELFGARLEDPDERFVLALALRVESTPV